MSHLSDMEFVAEVQNRYGGIPAEILRETELLKLLLPALRADIQMLEAYSRREGEPVGTPIHAVVGESDNVVSGEEVAQWDRETTGEFGLTTLPGGHFYFQPDATRLLDVIRQRLFAHAATTYSASGV